MPIQWGSRSTGCTCVATRWSLFHTETTAEEGVGDRCHCVYTPQWIRSILGVPAEFNGQGPGPVLRTHPQNLRRGKCDTEQDSVTLLDITEVDQRHSPRFALDTESDQPCVKGRPVCGHLNGYQVRPVEGKRERYLFSTEPTDRANSARPLRNGSVSVYGT